MKKFPIRLFCLLVLFVSADFAQGLSAQEGEGDVAAERADAVQTFFEGVKNLRATYTADIEISSEDFEGFTPSISYRQRVFDDGSADVQADVDHLPVPEEIPEALRPDEFSFGFLHTAEGTGVRFQDEAVMRDGSFGDDDDDLVASLFRVFDEIPEPSDEELAAMDLRQETEAVDGVECKVLSWIPKEYDPNNPKSSAMFCLAIGAEDKMIRSFVALDEKGEELFSVHFKNVNTNPVFGPEDFTFGKEVHVKHLDTDKAFGEEVQKLFFRKFIDGAVSPKSKRKRHTASKANAENVSKQPAALEEGTDIVSDSQPAPVRHTGLLAFCGGVLLALAVVGVLVVLQRRRGNP